MGSNFCHMNHLSKFVEKLCIFKPQTENEFLSVFDRMDAIAICDKHNASLPYSLAHINALRRDFKLTLSSRYVIGWRS